MIQLIPCPVAVSARRRRRLRPFKASVSLAVALSLASLVRPAGAQQIVHDPANYAKLIEAAQTQLKQLRQLEGQLDQAKRLYEGFNQASGVNGLAQGLASPALRQVLPDAQRYLDAAKGGFAGLGQIGAKAAQIREANRLYAAPVNDPAGQTLGAAGDRAARDLALGQAVADAGALRLAGLQQLQGGLDAAPNARAVMDLQARLAAEQAMIANDQTRLQGLAMAQAAEARLAEQRAREQVAAERSARMAAWKSLFAR